MIRSNIKQFLGLTGFFMTTLFFQNCGQEVNFNNGLQKSMVSEMNAQDTSALEIDSLDLSDVLDLVEVTNEDVGLPSENSPESDGIANNEEAPEQEEPAMEPQAPAGDVASRDEMPADDEMMDEMDEESSNPSNPSGMTQKEEEDSDEMEDSIIVDNNSNNDKGQEQAQESQEKNDDKPTEVAKNEKEEKSCNSSKEEKQEKSEVAKNEKEEKETAEEDNSQNYMYRCVLNGKGKSKHIGLLNGQVAQDKDTPDTLCMSQNACLNIMPALGFDVQGPQFTGYCKNGTAHTSVISDAEAFALVAE